jgi:hypothetical protein
MDNTPLALAGPPAAGSLERTTFKAWTMGKSPRSNAGETPKGQLSAETLVEVARDKPPLPAGLTLRVKPDRRCVQLPIPAGMDRRRPHC